MKNYQLALFAVIAILLMGFSTLPTFEDKCPHCGRSYGAWAPGDEAEVKALRRTHEATCSSRPKVSTASPVSNEGQVRQWIQAQELLRMERERERRRLDREYVEEVIRKREQRLKDQFEQDKKETLSQLKAKPKELGLKGKSELKIKEPEFSKGYMGSAPPYLADLDPKWPIVVDPKKVQGGTPESLRSANLKTHVLLLSLEEGAGDWEASIQYLKKRLADNPDDLAVRDALNLVRGYFQGYLGAKNVADNYYKYGIKKWLEGDFDQASRAFSRAYRENPDDMLLFRSFAHTLGLRDHSNIDKTFGSYNYFDIPEKHLSEILGISKEIEQNLAAARAAVDADPNNLELRATLNHFEGLAGYNDYLDIALWDKPEPLDKNALALINQGLEGVREKDFSSAWKAFDKAYEGHMDNRGILFCIHYSKGLDAAQRNNSQDIPEALWDQRTYEEYGAYQTKMNEKELYEIMKLRYLEKEEEEEMLELFFSDFPGQSSLVTFYRQIKNTEEENPFFGLLSEEEIQLFLEGFLFK